MEQHASSQRHRTLNVLVNTAAATAACTTAAAWGSAICCTPGMVAAADGTEDSAGRLERVLTTDPGMGDCDADAGYQDALTCKARRPAGLPSDLPELLVESISDGLPDDDELGWMNG